MSQMKADLLVCEELQVREIKHSNYIYRALTAGVVITEEDPSLLVLDANGAARNVDMPAPSANIDGKRWTIQNPAAGAFALTVRNNGGATIATVAQGKSTEVIVVNVAGTLTWKQINLLA